MRRVEFIAGPCASGKSTIALFRLRRAYLAQGGTPAVMLRTILQASLGRLKNRLSCGHDPLEILPTPTWPVAILPAGYVYRVMLQSPGGELNGLDNKSVAPSFEFVLRGLLDWMVPQYETVIVDGMPRTRDQVWWIKHRWGNADSPWREQGTDEIEVHAYFVDCPVGVRMVRLAALGEDMDSTRCQRARGADSDFSELKSVWVDREKMPASVTRNKHQDQDLMGVQEPIEAALDPAFERWALTRTKEQIWESVTKS